MQRLVLGPVAVNRTTYRPAGHVNDRTITELLVESCTSQRRSCSQSAQVLCRRMFMPRSQMAYDASATLRRIFPQFLAMIVQFYGDGKAAAAIIAVPAATADSLMRS